MKFATCNCPLGMKYHALNCPTSPGEEQNFPGWAKPAAEGEPSVSRAHAALDELMERLELGDQSTGTKSQ